MHRQKRMLRQSLLIGIGKEVQGSTLLSSEGMAHAASSFFVVPPLDLSARSRNQFLDELGSRVIAILPPSLPQHLGLMVDGIEHMLLRCYRAAYCTRSSADASKTLSDSRDVGHALLCFIDTTPDIFGIRSVIAYNISVCRALNIIEPMKA